ncbi:MAG: UDP-glucose/GDP-mannose dehydrogenase family protein [Candidatus Gastranaerophilales bacterium]|nr:UDP-glucose/GDP-mannose dehydrogenase family protein [Candidatus Gastranaerophilales bacterium]
MKLCVIGTGYVGLVAGACLADMGNDVTCVDNNEEIIMKLKNVVLPIYEPGLEDLVKYNYKEGRLNFTTDLKKAVREAQVCFIAVGTPQSNDGSVDLSQVYKVAEDISNEIKEYKVIVDKSTVPVGTAEKVAEIIKKNTKSDFDVVSNPEFLKQGAAVDDFLYPDRVIIGSDSQRATEIMQEIYSPFLRTANRIILMDVKSAEMTKYTANAFLAMKISFINEIANLCEEVGADAELVRIGIATDSRIGKKFLFPGLGYGGSCFPKDVKALVATAKSFNSDCKILEAVDDVNKKQRYRFIDKILNRFNNDVSNLTFGVWGLSFKPKTNDMREAPAVTIINELLKNGANIKAYDPQAMATAKTIFQDKIEYSKSAYKAIEDVDCMILMTEWNEFRRPDFDKMKSLMKQSIVFDGRNIYDAKRLTSRGIEYHR